MSEDRCQAAHPWREGFRCELADGHEGKHQTLTVRFPGAEAQTFRTAWGDDGVPHDTFVAPLRSDVAEARQK